MSVANVFHGGTNHGMQKDFTRCGIGSPAANGKNLLNRVRLLSCYAQFSGLAPTNYAEQGSAIESPLPNLDPAATEHSVHLGSARGCS